MNANNNIINNSKRRSNNNGDPNSPDSSLALIRSADIYQDSISQQRPNESLLEYWTRREKEVAQRAQRQSYLEQRAMRKMKKKDTQQGEQQLYRVNSQHDLPEDMLYTATSGSASYHSFSKEQSTISYPIPMEATTASHDFIFRDLEDEDSSFDEDLKSHDIVERDLLQSPYWANTKSVLIKGEEAVAQGSLFVGGREDANNKVSQFSSSSSDESDIDFDARRGGKAMVVNLHVDLEECSWSLLEQHLVYLSKRPDLILQSMLQTDHSHGNATPLHTACWKAPPPLALHMIALLPRIYQHMEHICLALDADGNTALHLCAANICQDLQNHRPTIPGNSTTYHDDGEDEEVAGGGDHYSSIPGFRGEDVLEALVLSAPRALTIQNKEGDTPLHLAVSSSFSTSHAVSLLTNGASKACFLQDCTGACPLHAAIANNVDERVLTVLLDAAPAAAQIPDNQGLLPLHYVAAFSHTPIAFVQKLIDVYPHAISAQTVDGDTPLHLAISNCKSEDELTISTVELLLGNHDVSDSRNPVFIENNEKVRRDYTSPYEFLQLLYMRFLNIYIYIYTYMYVDSFPKHITHYL
jgi:ankyrin repeat protein